MGFYDIRAKKNVTKGINIGHKQEDWGLLPPVRQHLRTDSVIFAQNLELAPSVDA